MRNSHKGMIRSRYYSRCTIKHLLPIVAVQYNVILDRAKIVDVILDLDPSSSRGSGTLIYDQTRIQFYRESYSV